MGWQKIFTNNVTNKGLTSKIYNSSYSSTKKKIIKNWAEDFTDISSKRTYRWPRGT